uniref:Uncharacterized protein n=1 Tax=Anguilla anguilla TaxID=7936 RepID=A0A0E9T293_ANGAN
MSLNFVLRMSFWLDVLYKINSGFGVNPIISFSLPKAHFKRPDYVQ